MLGRAAAADSEMRAEGLYSIGRWLYDAQQMPAIGMARHPVGIDGLARQCIGNEHRLARDICDAIAAMSNIGDVKPVDHKWIMHEA